ncbi:Uncharacterised protein [Shigella sonnei]|jgi:hypothetical protein|uniref:hypothetical protein n=1 Tax=Enterobacteriaceae TaxID=543 RepID=UPI000311215A|nr:hypothetical protein [Shigella sonnei]EZJ31837.1 hypothetical protein AD12_0296 [Escherichia coli 1-392-07_S4_C2]MCG9454714.1 hypothetical protein [Escherichia coli]SRN30062.1 Uncharacterised protein [Shigella flexneri]CSE40384.1 Uncharacterised protein [Shigella sonnei]CSF03145.1 Uncharacterised protein [Shigella sonnei]
MFDKFQQINAVLWPDNLKALRHQRRLQFFDGLIFIKDAMRSHNGNDVHVFLLENPSLIIACSNRGDKKGPPK